MLVSVLMILGGVLIMYSALGGCDCDTCWHRDTSYRRLAQFGLIMTMIGIVVNVYVFWYWGL